MPGGIDGLGFNAQTPGVSDGAAPAQQAEGQYRGQKVVQGGASQTSLVQDSLEEVSANFSEKTSKKLAERKARTKGGDRAGEVFEKYLKQIPKIGQPEKFQQLAESLKQQGNPSAGEILKQIRDFLDGDQRGGEGSGGLDGGEAALLLALEELVVAEGGSAELAAALREAKAEVGDGLRSFYEQQVQTYEGAGEVYNRLIGQYGEQDFMQSTELMIRKLGNDVSSQGTSLDATELKAKIDSLYHLEVARNTYLAFNELTTKMDQYATAS